MEVRPKESQWYEMFCHDPKITGSNSSQVDLTIVNKLQKWKSLMNVWSNVSQWLEMFCHDPEIIGSYLTGVKLRSST